MNASISCMSDMISMDELENIGMISEVPRGSY